MYDGYSYRTILIYGYAAKWTVYFWIEITWSFNGTCALSDADRTSRDLHLIFDYTLWTRQLLTDLRWTTSTRLVAHTVPLVISSWLIHMYLRHDGPVHDPLYKALFPGMLVWLNAANEEHHYWCVWRLFSDFDVTTRSWAVASQPRAILVAPSSMFVVMATIWYCISIKCND